MKSSRYWFGVLSGLIVAALIGFLLLPNLGVFPIAATGETNILDWWGHVNLENYLERNAPETSIPVTADPEEGFRGYLAMCLHCHGGPDAARREWAEYMLPKPPELWKMEAQQEMTDGELFYIITNGIRMTGMPAFGLMHSDQEIWNMVAFLRQFDQLTEQQKQEMRQVAGKFHHGDHHHNGENENERHKDGDEGHHDDMYEEGHSTPHE